MRRIQAGFTQACAKKALGFRVLGFRVKCLGVPNMTKHPQSGKEGPEKRNSQKHSRFGDGRGGGCKGPAWHALPNFGEMVEQIENLCCWWGPGGGPKVKRPQSIPERPETPGSRRGPEKRKGKRAKTAPKELNSLWRLKNLSPKP